MSLTLATWNVNSIRVRLPLLLDWLGRTRPDALLLQELKCQAGDFPHAAIEAAGYHALVAGQKTYNGVAIVSRRPARLVRDTLPGDETDDQARYIEADLDGLRLASIYLPNGNPAPGDKFAYKLAWMERLAAQARRLRALDQPVVLGGDFNVCPADLDVCDPAAWAGDALCRPESRAALRQVLHLGYTDSLRALNPGVRGLYTWWDYQAGAWPRDKGLRIDHLLLNPQAADRLEAAGIDRTPRSAEKASDHTPVWVRLDLDRLVTVAPAD
jgi:exodeoxyribonuclease-3